jgi:hypothetical protein
MQSVVRYTAYAVAGALVFISALADPLGIGGSPGFGGKQVAGVIVGIAGVAAMLWVSTRRR